MNRCCWQFLFVALFWGFSPPTVSANRQITWAGDGILPFVAFSAAAACFEIGQKSQQMQRQ